MTIPEQSTLILTHFGRRSGKPFTVKIWYTLIDGELWIGSLDEDKNWVKNLRSGGSGKVDFGSGAIECSFEPVVDAAGTARYRSEVAKKYPVLSRIIGLFSRGGRHVAFRARTKDGQPHSERGQSRETGA